MRSFALYIALSAGAVATLAAPSVAHACDAGIVVSSSAPADGATGVQTNAHLFVFFSYTNDWLDLSLTRTDTGATIPGVVSIRPGGNLEDRSRAVATFVPSDPLPADTPFELTLTGDFRSGETEQTLTFSTGSDPVTSNLTYDGIASVSWERLERGDYDLDPGDSGDTGLALEPECADGDARWSFSVQGSAAVPEAVAYSVYRQGFALATAATPELLYQTFPETPREVCLQVRAIDQAGQVDSNTAEACVDAGATNDDTGGDTDTDTDQPEDTWREDTWREDTWNYWYDDYWYEDYWDWRGPGCVGVTYRICGPRGPSSPILIFPAVLALALMRRRRSSSP